MTYLITAATESYFSRLPRRQKPFSRWFREAGANAHEMPVEDSGPFPMPLTSMEDMILLAEIPREAPAPTRGNLYGIPVMPQSQITKSARQYEFEFSDQS